MTNIQTTVVLLSGGLDSTVLVGWLLNQRNDVDTVSFDYGQRHRRELDAARAVAERYGVRHDVVDLTGVGRLLTGSALTDDVAVPHGHYAADNMAATVVPNRNMILLSVAVGIAAARGHQSVATAVHAGDHAVYPDCRPEFTRMASMTAQAATEGYGDVDILAPFVRRSKTDIAGLGADLDAPLNLTWSCYEGGDRHCGRCGTCVERWEAFRNAGIDDPTDYADPDYARRAVAA